MGLDWIYSKRDQDNSLPQVETSLATNFYVSYLYQLNCISFVVSFLKLFLLSVQACSFSEIHLPHWESMTDKRRKHHAEEGEAEGRGEASELQAILRMFLESAAKDKLDAEKREEEREIHREEEKAARRREEVRELAELNERRDKQREEAARQASERLREEQKAFAEEERKKQQEAIDRAYEHQKTLVKLQAESGAKADEARRVEAAKAEEVRRDEAEANRKRDRALAGIPSYRDQEDVEDYLITSERKQSCQGLRISMCEIFESAISFPHQHYGGRKNTLSNLTEPYIATIISSSLQRLL